MYTALLILHTLVAIGLAASVLLQSGRSAGLSGAITGGAEQLFGKKKGMDNLLARISTGMAIAFMVTSLALTVLARNR
ncbi:MAG: preprotein translocase subunit SecG [Firmicutes bacterium]|nr:preprotein translocase subunit SecG [Bacillota bacterium]